MDATFEDRMKSELIRIILFICFDQIFESDKSVRGAQL